MARAPEPPGLRTINELRRMDGLAPPPPQVAWDAVRWVEDRDHGPSRRRTWRCWLGKCPHKEEPCKT